jgi:hypothetical protein
MSLSPSDNQVFDDYTEMFLTSGWGRFVEDMKKNQNAIAPTIMSADVEIKDIYRLKGRNDVWQYIISLKDQLDQIKKAMEDQDE